MVIKSWSINYVGVYDRTYYDSGVTYNLKYAYDSDHNINCIDVYDCDDKYITEFRDIDIDDTDSIMKALATL